MEWWKLVKTRRLAVCWRINGLPRYLLHDCFVSMMSVHRTNFPRNLGKRRNSLVHNFWSQENFYQIFTTWVFVFLSASVRRLLEGLRLSPV